ncbi:MAG: serine hydrolase [Gammaproteobacteria bacterium]|nr:serine hydrolase [Gammaproteobacteria bacterium]
MRVSLLFVVLTGLSLALSGVVAGSPGLQPAASADAPLWQQLDSRKLKLRSKAALVVDHFGNALYERNADQAMPIASLTKLMTAMVVIDSGLPLQEKIEITKEDRDLIRLTGSRLKYGARLTRSELLTLALMSSENRAAAALARTHPGGTQAFVDAMNAKARALGMHKSRFADAAGLDAGNVASAQDLARLVFAAMDYPLIREATTRRQLEVRPYRKRGPLRFGNTNRLLRSKAWDIQVSKTGYINEAGRCLVMHTEFEGTPTVLVLLNSYGKLTPFGDANRVRKWIRKSIEQHDGQQTRLESLQDS